MSKASWANRKWAGEKNLSIWATIYPSVISVGGGLNRNAGGLKRKFVDLKKLQLRSVEIILGKSKMSRGNRFEYFALGYIWAHASDDDGVDDDTIRYHMMPYYTIWYHTIPYDTIGYHTIPYYTLRYHTISYDTKLYHTIQYYMTKHFFIVTTGTKSHTCLFSASIPYWTTLCSIDKTLFHRHQSSREQSRALVCHQPVDAIELHNVHRMSWSSRS